MNTQTLQRPSKGFTLIEVMIVVLIISILAALAYFNYGKYAFRARRADGKEWLARVASAQERFYTNFNVYATSLTGGPPTGLGFAAATSEKGYYTVATANGPTGDTQSYQLTATPVAGSAQAGDACSTLVINNQNKKTATGPQNNGPCW